LNFQDRRIIVIVLVCISIVALALLGGLGMSAFIKTTSTNEFCISCHEMETTVYQEYRRTTHYKNVSGVSAGCADCHIPHDLGTTIIRKFAAVKDIYHHLLGTIDTTEKFEARRLEMAQRVWASMKASNSRECRNCHSFDSMDMDKQRQRASKMHQQATKDGETCIECHKGIAHKAVHDLMETSEEENIILEF